jgi:glutathione S-transferase
MKIYDVPNFPNPLRVRIALAEKNALDQVTFIPVDVMGGEHRTTEFLAKNPAAAIPVLELEDGTSIAESSAIIEYIDHQLDGPQLTGSDAKSRAQIHMQQRRAEFMVLDAIGAYFHNATEGLGPDLETDQVPAWGEKQKASALKGLAYFDQLLASNGSGANDSGDNSFVVGEQFSVADITLYAGLVFADFCSIDIPAQLTHLLAWQERMANRPSLQSIA